MSRVSGHLIQGLIDILNPAEFSKNEKKLVSQGHVPGEIMPNLLNPIVFSEKAITIFSKNIISLVK